MGHCYKNGTGVEKNLPEALKYYLLSAEQGNAYGQFRAAMCYKRGEGVEINLKEMVKYLRLSSDQGYSCALLNDGFFYV